MDLTTLLARVRDAEGDPARVLASLGLPGSADPRAEVLRLAGELLDAVRAQTPTAVTVERYGRRARVTPDGFTVLPAPPDGPPLHLWAGTAVLATVLTVIVIDTRSLAEAVPVGAAALYATIRAILALRHRPLPLGEHEQRVLTSAAEDARADLAARRVLLGAAEAEYAEIARVIAE